MIANWKRAAAALAAGLAIAAPAAAQQIENELVLITPVARTLTDWYIVCAAPMPHGETSKRSGSTGITPLARCR